ncbi:MAG: efflux RND transporter periplasmic adaptor subunit [Arcobacteraceae bacterium]|jgi:macrolide-specific efflux system membrane fusion protein|nr:efflux RND transporter periplasmic adaptor subunit [Arcobacteraceae bacterium]
MKRKLLLLVVAAILLGISYATYAYFNPSKDTNNERLSTKVIKGNIENLVTATGTINPKDYVDVGAQVSGQLEVLHVELGDVVKKGDLLAQIDVTVFKAKVDQSKAQLKYQEAQLKEKIAQYELAQILYTRQEKLYENNATSLESLQNAKLSLQSATAQIEMLKAQIEQSKSSIQADEANLEYTRIYAPMEGTVVSISAKQGQTLNANQSAPVILQIADLSTMTVKAEVSEADITKLKKGIPVYFKTLGNNRRWNSTLDKIEPTPVVENNVVLYNALFDIENKDGHLMTYMTTQVFFVLGSAKDVLMVPLSAVQRKQKESFVTLLLEDGTLKEQKVELGVSNRIHTEVISGLKENDTVLINQATAQRNGNNKPRNGFVPGMKP